MMPIFEPEPAQLDEYLLLRPAADRIEELLETKLTPDSVAHTAEVLDLLRDDDFDFPSESAPLLVEDCALHEFPGDGTTIVRQFAASDEAARLPEPERRLLMAMKDARLALLRVDDSWEDVGARVHDVLLDRDLLLLDEDIGCEAPGTAVVARIYDVGGYWMATRALVPLVPFDVLPMDEVRKGFEEVRRDSEADVGVCLARLAIGLEAILEEIEGGAGGEDVGVRPALAPVRAPKLPGRNDPCPCGSGRKYKKCCALAARPQA